MNHLELTGQTNAHVRQDSASTFSAQPPVLEAFLEMKAEAAADGFELHPVSAFRDFQTQLSIWNQKYDGIKPLYDLNGKIVNVEKLGADEIIIHILRWTALPGGSRHHWGTDIDVIDLNAVPDGYQIKLLPEEYLEGGLFYNLNCWLEKKAERHGFFKPYRTFRGGVFPEPWHISFRSIAEKALNELTINVLEEIIEKVNISGKTTVLETLPDIFQKFILNIDPLSDRPG